MFSGGYYETAMKDLNEDVVEEDAVAEHYDYGSDSDLEDAEDLQATEDPSNIDTTINRPQNPTRYFQVPHFYRVRSRSSGKHASSYYKERTREGRIIKVQDVAFITYVRLQPVCATG